MGTAGTGRRWKLFKTKKTGPAGNPVDQIDRARRAAARLEAPGFRTLQSLR